MRISKLTLFMLILILLLSLFAARISNLISVNYNYVTDDQQLVSQAYDPNLVLDDQNKHLMWFMQITDIHLSIFHDPARISDFNDFCNSTLDIVRPTVVLASGDLADAKEIDTMGSRQFIQEWHYYQEILQKNEVEKKTKWLDIRGNHDNFNVPSITEVTSFYHQFSIQGKQHLRSYMHQVVKDGETYSFIGVDACLDPGPRRPFNFIGLLKLEEYRTLEKFERQSRNGNGTVWFGHYPTSTIISPDPGVRNLMRNGIAYLCGHLHTLAGTVPKMYTLHHTGTLELELGDWKDNRLYRVAAFDHGLFAFTDVVHGEWPVILITNPKHGLFNLPKKEPLERMTKSTHIRILVFSPGKIQSVRVKIDKGDWRECQNIDGPLYVSKWDPTQYSVGTHEIRVVATNIGGKSNEIAQPFVLDDTKLNFAVLPRIALMLDADKCFYNMFCFMVLASVLPLVVLKCCHWRVTGSGLALEKNRILIVMRRKGIVRKLWIIASVDRLFYPLVLYPAYVAVGPWFVGEVIEGYYGAVFAWGTLVQWKFLPGSFTYFYGFTQLVLFHIPFTLLVSHCVDCRFKAVCWGNSPCCRTGVLWQHLPCFLVLCLQTSFAYSFWQAYGTMAVIMGPLRTWSVFMYCFLWFSTISLKAADFAETSLVWVPGYRHRASVATAEDIQNQNQNNQNSLLRES